MPVSALVAPAVLPPVFLGDKQNTGGTAGVTGSKTTGATSPGTRRL
jgi:hypothetical protein